MTITAAQRKALDSLARSVAELTAAFGVEDGAGTKPAAVKTKAKRPPAIKAPTKKYSPVDSGMLPAVREERRKLILQKIAAAGGAVTREKWLEIAGWYGYDSRQLGGFFAKKGGIGLVEMTADRKMVQLTSHGRDRL
jgi:hypothetical protein